MEHQILKGRQLPDKTRRTSRSTAVALILELDA
jgi:hypothetical protein